jgi:hypothetical protein
LLSAHDTLQSFSWGLTLRKQSLLLDRAGLNMHGSFRVQRILFAAAISTALAGCTGESFDSISYERKVKYVSEWCEQYEGTPQWQPCINEQIKITSRQHQEFSNRMTNVAAALNGMTMSGNTGNVQTAPANNTGRLVYLQNQWVNNGNRMCQYSDGSVLNIGFGMCPRNR